MEYRQLNKRNYLNVLIIIGNSTCYKEEFQKQNFHSLFLKYIYGLELKCQSEDRDIGNLLHSLKYLSNIRPLVGTSIQGILEVTFEQVEESIQSNVRNFSSVTDFSTAARALNSLCSEVDEIRHCLTNLSRLPKLDRESLNQFRKVISNLEKSMAKVVRSDKITRQLEKFCFLNDDVELKQKLKKCILLILLAMEYLSLSADDKDHLRIVELLFKQVLKSSASHLTFNSGALNEIILFWKECHQIALEEYDRIVPNDSSALFSKLFSAMNDYVNLWKSLMEISKFKMDINRLEEALKYSFKNTQVWKPTLDYIKDLTKAFGDDSSHEILMTENICQMSHHVTQFHKEMSVIERKMIDLLQASFQEPLGVKEGCMILDSFHNLSEKSKIEEIYKYKSQLIIENLKRDIDKHKNNVSKYYGCLKRFYSSENVSVVLHRFFANRILGLIEMLQFSTVYLSDPGTTDVIRRYCSIFKSKIDSIFPNTNKTEYKNIHDSRKIYTSFLLKRNRNSDMYLDVNIRYELIEACLYNIVVYSFKSETNATKDIVYHKQGTLLVQYHRTRQVVREYNFVVSSLSLQEYYMFDSQMSSYLKSLVMNGIYKMQWQDTPEFNRWHLMSLQAVTVVMELISCYKRNNSQIDEIIRKLTEAPTSFRGLKFEDDEMCSSSRFVEKIRKRLQLYQRTVTNKCHNLMKRIETVTNLGLLKDSSGNLKSKFETRLIRLLSRSYAIALIRAVEDLLSLFEKDPSAPPFIKIDLNLCNFRNDSDDNSENYYIHKSAMEWIQDLLSIYASSIPQWKTLILDSLNENKGLQVVQRILKDRMSEIDVDLCKYFKNYYIFCDMSDLNPDLVLSRYENTTAHLDADIKNIRAFMSKCQNFYSKTKIHFYAIDNKKMVKSVYSILKQWDEAFLNRFRSKFRENISKSPVKTPEAQKLIEETQNYAELLRKYDILNEEEEEQLKEFIKSFNSARERRAKTVTTVKKVQKQVSKDSRLTVFTNLRKQFEKTGPFSVSSWKYEDALAEIERTRSLIGELQIEEEYPKEISQFRIVLNSQFFIWRTVEEWRILKETICHQEFKDLNFGKIKTQLISIIEKAEEASTTNAQTSNIKDAGQIVDEIVHFSRIISILELASQPYFHEDHFSTVRSKLNYDRIKIEPMTKVEDLIPFYLPPGSFDVDVFAEIRTAMRHQSVVTEFLHDCKSKFRTLGIETKKHQTTGIYVIENVLSIQSMIYMIEKKIDSIDGATLEVVRGIIVPLKVKIDRASSLLNVILSFQRNLVSISKLHLGYALKLQSGKAIIRVAKIRKMWKFILSNYLTKSYFVNMNVDPRLVSVLNKLSDRLKVLLVASANLAKTRKMYFPRLYFDTRERDPTSLDLEKYVSAVIPSVDEISVRSGQIVGYRGFYGEVVDFADGIKMNRPIEVLFKEIHSQVLFQFRKEIIHGCKSFTVKTLAKIIPHQNPQVYFIVRMILFSKELQRFMGTSKHLQQRMRKSLSILSAQHEAIWKVLKAALRPPNPSQHQHRNRRPQQQQQTHHTNTMNIDHFRKLASALNVEYYVKAKLECFSAGDERDSVFAAYNSVKWNLYKRNNEDEVIVSFHDESEKYEFEPVKPTEQFPILHSQLERNTIQLLRNFVDGRCSVVRGTFKTGKQFSIRHFAFIMGRFVKFISVNVESDLSSSVNLEAIVKSKDLLALQISDNVESLITMTKKLNDLKVSFLNYSNVVNANSVIPRTFILTKLEPKDDVVNCQLTRMFSILKPNLYEVVKYVLYIYQNLNETLTDAGVEEDKEIRRLYVLLSFQRHYFNTKLNISTTKILLNNLLNTKSRNNVDNNESDAETFSGKVIRYYDDSVFNSKLNSEMRENIVEFGRKKKITITDDLVKILSRTSEIFHLHDVMIFSGKSLTHKTTTTEFLSRTAVGGEMECLRFPASGLAEETGSECQKIVASVIDDPEKRAVIVVEGSFLERILWLLYPLHNPAYDVVISGQSFKNGSVLKLIYETDEIGSLSPAIASMAHVYYFEPITMSWSSVLKRRLFEEFGSNIDVDDILLYFEKLLQIRETIVKSDSFYGKYNQINMAVSMIKMYEIGNIDPNLAVYICTTSLFQDISGRDEIRADILIRKAIPMRDIPNDSVIFDYYYDFPSKLWKSIPKNYSVYYRSMYLAVGLVQSSVDLEICGESGSGKSCFLNYLETQCGTVDTLKVKISSSTSCKRLTQIINYCVQKQFKNLKKNKVLILLDDVEASIHHVDRCVKYIMEYRRWTTAGYNFRDVYFANSKNPASSAFSYKSVRLYLAELGFESVLTYWNSCLKTHFSNFELDVKFLVDKVLMTTTRIFREMVREKLCPLYVEDFRRVMEGLLLSHEDCHDTHSELFELWLHELREVIVQKLKFEERSLILERICKVVERDFADVSSSLSSFLRSAEDDSFPFFGNFSNKENFYIEIEAEEMKEYSERVWKNEYSITNLDLSNPGSNLVMRQLCYVMKMFSIPSRHLVLINHDREALDRIIRICCFIKSAMTVTISERSASWRKILRRVFVIAGLKNQPVCLQVIYHRRDKDQPEFLESLNNLISHGYDINILKNEDEFEYLFRDKSEAATLSEKVKTNLRCIVNYDNVVKVNCDKDDIDIDSVFQKRFQILYVGREEQYKRELLQHFAQQRQGRRDQDFFPENILTAIPGKLNLQDSSTSFEQYKRFLKIFFGYADFHISEDVERSSKLKDIESKIESNKQDIDTSLKRITNLTQEVSVTRMSFESLCHELSKRKKEEMEFSKEKIGLFEQMGSEQASYFKLRLNNGEDTMHQNLHFQTIMSNLRDSVRSGVGRDEVYIAMKSDPIIHQFVAYVACWTNDNEDENDEEEKDVMDEFQFMKFLDRLTRLNETTDVSDLYKRQRSSTKTFDIKRLHKIKNHSFVVFLLKKLDALTRSEKVASKSYASKLETQQRRIKTVKTTFLQMKVKLLAVKQTLSEMSKRKESLSSKIESDVSELEILTQKTKDTRSSKDAFEEIGYILQTMKQKNVDLRKKLAGTILFGAAFLGYAGPKDNQFRQRLKKSLMKLLDSNGIEYLEGFLPFVVQKSQYETLKNEPLESVVENILLLNVTSIPVAVIDPYDICFVYLKKYLRMNDVRIVQAGDPVNLTHKTILSTIDPRSVDLQSQYYVYVTSEVNSSESSWFRSNSLFFDLYETDLFENMMDKMWKTTMTTTAIPYKRGFLELSNPILREFETLNAVLEAMESETGATTLESIAETFQLEDVFEPRRDPIKSFAIRACCLHAMKILVSFDDHQLPISSRYETVVEAAVAIFKDKQHELASATFIKSFIKTFTQSVYKEMRSLLTQKQNAVLTLSCLQILYFSKSLDKASKTKAITSLLMAESSTMSLIERLIGVLARGRLISEGKKRLFSFLWALKKKSAKLEKCKRPLKAPEFGNILTKFAKSFILLIGGVSIITKVLFDNAEQWTNDNVNIVTPTGDVCGLIRLFDECMLSGRWIVIRITPECTLDYFELVYYLLVKVHCEKNKHQAFQLWLHAEEIDHVPKKILESCKIIHLS